MGSARSGGHAATLPLLVLYVGGGVRGDGRRGVGGLVRAAGLVIRRWSAIPLLGVLVRLGRQRPDGVDPGFPDVLAATSAFRRATHRRVPVLQGAPGGHPRTGTVT